MSDIKTPCVKVVFIDGSSEILRGATSLIHDEDHNLFRVDFKKDFVLFPDIAVRSVFSGSVEDIGIVEGGRKTRMDEVFMYE